MAEPNAAKVDYHRAMLKVLMRVRDLEAAFETWGMSARVLDAADVQVDDEAQHAVIDEARAAFARIVERFPAATQMMGVDQLVAIVMARQESLS